MSIIKRNCNFCKEEYLAQTRYLKRNQGIYCSRKCSANQNSINKINKNIKTKTFNYICALCSKEFYRAPSKQIVSKSGLYFCSREHKDEAQRIGGIKAIQPNHYGTGDGKHDYRIRALTIYGSKCQNCKWNIFPEILEVNHRNCNREDNHIDNLEVLCANCHKLFHWLTGTGAWRASPLPFTLTEANTLYYRPLDEYFS